MAPVPELCMMKGIRSSRKILVARLSSRTEIVKNKIDVWRNGGTDVARDVFTRCANEFPAAITAGLGDQGEMTIILGKKTESR